MTQIKLPYKEQPVEIDKLGIIAGSGLLPRHVYDACIEQGIEVHVIGLENQTSRDLFQGVEIEFFPVHSVKKIINKMNAIGIKYVVCAGVVKRTSLSKLLLDFKAAKLLAMIMKAGLNDNAILGAVLEFLEREGFVIIPPEKIATQIVAKSGSMGSVKPTPSAMQDIRKGAKILKGIAAFDIGQALVMQNGLVLGVEAVEGTDQLIERCGKVQQKGESCILLKVTKPQQDKRIDLPCIGPDTITRLHQYHFHGVAVEAGVSLILDKKETIRRADELGVFVFGLDAD
ncbi:LpxI family protein [Candidatus Lariskella endosymbiont of Epinotia ramella]|uniref:LpxI family protein n=1 Tax=Candidatus Lariskella endosymbiont of Epinotia ramella TaxID=3066224 RepID=UPI0030CCEE6B